MSDGYWWKPRDHCEQYVSKRRIVNKCAVVEAMSKANFDKLLGNGGFIDGPFRSMFGNEYGEPYNPNHQAYGMTKDGRIVFTELSKNAPELEEKR